MLKINVINKSGYPLPKHETEFSAGIDLRAVLDKNEVLNPGQRMLIGTGLFMELPVGYEAQIRPRSGLALKYGLGILNSPGTIDADYRGEIKVLLINHGQEPMSIISGDRIAQMIVNKYEPVFLNEVSLLTATERDAGGYGHTGKN